jgi:hypothetical protein
MEELLLEIVCDVPEESRGVAQDRFTGRDAFQRSVGAQATAVVHGLLEFRVGLQRAEHLSRHGASLHVPREADHQGERGGGEQRRGRIPPDS